MTIQEAIKSGKPFKRPSFRNWYRIDKDRYVNAVDENDIVELGIRPSDLLMDDWQTKSEPTIIWVNIYPSGTIASHANESLARECCGEGGVTKKFIEVIE